MVLYWLENGIVGLFNLPKIALASAPVVGLGTGGLARPNPLPGLVGRVSLMVFFAFHYGIFWAVHGLFVFVLFGGSENPSSASGDHVCDELPDWWTLAAISLSLSHGVSFVTTFLGRREYLAVSPSEQMRVPYSRVMVLHATILAGGFPHSDPRHPCRGTRAPGRLEDRHRRQGAPQGTPQGGAQTGRSHPQTTGRRGPETNR